MSPSRPDYRWLVLAGTVLVFACAAVMPGLGEPADAGQKTVVTISGNELGHIRPCGCSKPVLGGIHRRAHKLRELRKKHPSLVAVSLGDLVAAGGIQQRAKFETFLSAMDETGYRALALGRGELLLGLEYLSEQAGSFETLHFIALNLTVAGKRPFKESVRLDGTPWTVTGLMPNSGKVPGAIVHEPKASLLKLLSGLTEADRVLVLWSGPEKSARLLAGSVPESWKPRVLVCFGGGFDAPVLLKPESGVRILSIGSKGRHLALVRPDEEAPLTAVHLPESEPQDEVVVDMLNGYRETVRSMNLIENMPRTASASAFVGRSECVTCHEDTCDLLGKSEHMRAFASLEKTGDEYDPECVVCHVTGWGFKGGYVSPEKTPMFKNVSCEACHGASGDHVKDQGETPHGKVGQKFCLKCHDADNSPKFKYETYWEKMKHPR